MKIFVESQNFSKPQLYFRSAVESLNIILEQLKQLV